jgi:hypothetical protein
MTMLSDHITYRLTISDAIDIAQALERDAQGRREHARQCVKRYGADNPVSSMAEACAATLERHAAALRARYMGTPTQARARLGLCECGHTLIYRQTPTMGAVFCALCDHEIAEELEQSARRAGPPGLDAPGHPLDALQEPDADDLPGEER